ncbi:hypothetical protein SAMN04489864_101481 [Pedobacter insulae]|uniref:Uncharacterized protein n=2 Tax=Pedobacter insulae TaxID=414048 RepID=A0A1I2TU97_9SPHI|nr:hypothetical protein SAMN04489864_101481 [Pedobacter insulae]
MITKQNHLILLLFLQALLFFSCKESDAQFAEKLITRFEEKSINRDSIDWKVFREKVMERSKVSKELGIIAALTLNNNPHSSYYYQGKVLKGIYPQKTSNDSCNLMRPFKRKNFKDIGYINIPKLYAIPNTQN